MPRFSLRLTDLYSRLQNLGREPIFFPNAADFDGFWFIFSIRGIAASVLTRLR